MYLLIEDRLEGRPVARREGRGQLGVVGLDEPVGLVHKVRPVFGLLELRQQGQLVQPIHALILLATGLQAVDKAGGSGAQIAFKIVAIGPLFAGYFKNVPQISQGHQIQGLCQTLANS